MTEIFREVDEDVRRDQYMALWQRYRWLLIGAVVLVVGGTAIGTGWREYASSQKQERGERFAAATALAEADRHEDAARAFAAFADDVGSEYAALAQLREAAALAANGDQAAAVGIYDQVAGDGGIDDVLRELAQVLAAQHLLDANDAAGAESRLEPLASGAGPWRHMARELQGLAALQGGRSEDARAIFSELTETAGVPNGVRRRSAELLAALGGPVESEVPEVSEDTQ